MERAIVVAAALALTCAAAAAAPAQSQTLGLGNKTSGCVRFFVEGVVHDVYPGHEYYTNRFTFGRRYMASAFRGKCGGAALWNTHFTPGRAAGQVVYWDVG